MTTHPTEELILVNDLSAAALAMDLILDTGDPETWQHARLAKHRVLNTIERIRRLARSQETALGQRLASA
jgi:hypothetical protein